MKKRKDKSRGSWPCRLRIKLTLSLVFIIGAASSYVGNSDGITIVTSRGERKTFKLPDDTTLEINAMTSLVLREEKGRRTLVLEQGEVRASLNHGVSKPIDVEVNHLILKDVGTEYDVLAHGPATEISVTKGALRAYELRSDGRLVNPIVLSKSKPGRDPVDLRSGASGRFQERDGAVWWTPNPDNMQRALDHTGWINAEVHTLSQPLDLIAWEFNGFNRSQIEIDDPEVARTLIGAHCRLTHLHEFLSQLPDLGLESVLVRGGASEAPIYLVRRASDSSKHAEHH